MSRGVDVRFHSRVVSVDAAAGVANLAADGATPSRTLSADLLYVCRGNGAPRSQRQRQEGQGALDLPLNGAERS